MRDDGFVGLRHGLHREIVGEGSEAEKRRGDTGVLGIRRRVLHPYWIDFCRLTDEVGSDGNGSDRDARPHESAAKAIPGHG